jgi:hypothetical protein
MTSAVLDACVLYSAPLRDLWMNLTVQAVFQPKWTAQIQEEWIKSVLENRPDLKREQLERTRQCMERAGRDWEVPEYEPLIPGLALPDPNDRHVLAAAIASETSVIVTFNLSDFPKAALAPHGICALHPDVFATELLGEDPEGFLAAARIHRAALKNPPKSPDEFLETLRGAGLAKTVAKLRDHGI